LAILWIMMEVRHMSEKKERLFSNVWTIPNLLSLIRLLMIPVFYVLFQRGQMMASLIVFLVAAATDWVDGQIARRYNQISALGKFLDPLADKLMLITVLLCLSWRQMVPQWLVIVLIVKELVLILGGLFIYKKREVVVHSDMVGKVATTGFSLGVVMSFFPEVTAPWASIVLYLSFALSLYALVHYARWNFFGKGKKEVEQTDSE
jgi:cardiolipin synthase